MVIIIEEMGTELTMQTTQVGLYANSKTKDWADCTSGVAKLYSHNERRFRARRYGISQGLHNKKMKST